MNFLDFRLRIRGVHARKASNLLPFRNNFLQYSNRFPDFRNNFVFPAGSERRKREISSKTSLIAAIYCDNPHFYRDFSANFRVFPNKILVFRGRVQRLCELQNLEKP